jgi:hypothetical protein
VRLSVLGLGRGRSPAGWRQPFAEVVLDGGVFDRGMRATRATSLGATPIGVLPRATCGLICPLAPVAGSLEFSHRLSFSLPEWLRNDCRKQSAWKSRDALYVYARTEPHRGIMTGLRATMSTSTFTFW